MRAKVREKELAIELRKKGLSYRDILEQVPVAKSSLSLWLKDLPLTEEEKRYLKKRKSLNISRGRINAAVANRRNRLKREQIFLQEAKTEFITLSPDPFFHIGVALYWAEGVKRNNFFAFTNSDIDMIKLFVRWIERFVGVSREDLHLQLYIHKPYAHENCEEYWSLELGIPMNAFRKTVFKPHVSLVKKRPNYKGCLRVSVPKSSGLLFKMKVWQNMLSRYY
jgi:hypothetical protein